MQTRSVRITVLTLLLAAPLAAALFLWTIDRRAADAVAASNTVIAHVDRMRDAITATGAAQQGYVAPGQLDEPWFERTDAHVQALRGEVKGLRPRLRSTEAVGALDALAQSVDALQEVDARTRENLTLGQDLMAADVIFSDGRNILDGMVARLRDVQRAERTATETALRDVARARWAAVGVLMLLPVTVAGLLFRVPRAPAVSGVPQVPPGAGTQGTPDAFATSGSLSVDLAAAAALCTELSRVTQTAALPPLFARAADLLHASGVTLWMSAAEQLFAVLGHGYPAERLARFGPIARSADNVVATAWRTGRITAIAGESNTPGALAAPMFAPASCIGVLALEIRDGREQDPAVQAVAAMVAAQLATAVAAWPAASDAPASEAEARTA